MVGNGRNLINYEGWIFRPVNIEEYSLIDWFDCGKQDLNEFFNEEALQHNEELLAKTYCFEKENKPTGLISLSNDSLRLTQRKRKKLIGFETTFQSFPAVKIARLGIQKDFQRLGIGSKLLNCCKILFLKENRTGCRLLTVDAYNDEKTVNFYLKNNFKFLHDKDKNDETRIMFCDLKPYISSIQNAT